MKVVVDKLGRVVIPKKVREHLGLKPGVILQLIEHEHEILLKPEEHNDPIQRKGGILVFMEKAVGNV